MTDLLSLAGPLLGALAATVLTLVVFSRVWGVSGAFRTIEHLLLGLTTGYIAAVALRSVLGPGLVAPLARNPIGNAWLWVVLLLILLMALRFSRRATLKALGLIPAALLAGAAAALAIAGAARGTLVPQILVHSQIRYLPDTAPAANILAGLLAALVTISTLLYFQQREPAAFQDVAGGKRWWDSASAGLGRLGYLAVMLAFGALLASTAGARLTLLIDRVQYLWRIWVQLLG